MSWLAPLLILTPPLGGPGGSTCGRAPLTPPYLKNPLFLKAYILTVGDEILIGQVTDTNATFMAAALNEAGYEVVEHLSVADSREGIMNGLARALESADVVLMTGGLGPTKDDITKKVLADYFETDLVFHAETWDRLQAFYRQFGREAAPHHREQCELPASATILTNLRGTAPGMWLERDGKVVISMPGVPYEMRKLVRDEALPRLAEYNQDDVLQRSLTILTAGAGESVIAEQIAPVEDSMPEHMSLAYLPDLGTVRLRITTRGTDEARLQAELTDVREQIEAIIGELIYGYGPKNLAQCVGERLLAAGKTVVTAESCTGGMISSMITANAGSSAYFLGGVVSYSNPLKQSLLGVKAATLKKHGAVSEATVREMAEGARKKLGADYAMAASGIAGPDGGTPEKPVGTIWIAVAGPEGTQTQLLQAGKDRKRNIIYTAHQALNLLRRVVKA
ncbi:competence/damage-inducible protein A [Lewinella lacunae]|uniref:CinA-like protein n=1 Tax=Neolewinella lacunae TaxID=1517758 RepID=A0A923PHW0_9BACT|nr:competence/damage-inducible protein A [Neolewinella lacunae]